MLPYDEARCTGQQCPSANQCRRYAERHVGKGVIAHYAAFHVRREAGANAGTQGSASPSCED